MSPLDAMKEDGDLPLERGLKHAFAQIDSTPRIPQRFGNYDIVGVLGTGGMGVVYDAVQAMPRRPVALKVIRPGHATTQLRRRFAQEAEFLGRLEHPGIAQIYESGIADEGLGAQPFVSMERIEGKLLDAWRREDNPTRDERILMMARVADAVHHAHQRSVVHRDLKPGNVMVQAEGAPKVVDFGVARALSDDSETRTLLTTDGQLVGTLPYMSPEQLVGDPRDIDTRSDVYALGAMLYELLTGRRPLDVSSTNLVTSIERICTQAPEPLGALDPALRGDLETITAKAMAKAPGRRYESAAALADDLRRVLGNEPILARPTGRFYRARKFIARNRALVLSTSLVIVGLTLATVLALGSAREQSRLRAVAEEAEHAAQRVAYAAQIAAADAALRGGDLRALRARLEAAEGDQRGWAWQHLDTSMHQSLRRVALPALEDVQGRVPRVCSFSPDGSEFVYLQPAGGGTRLMQLDWSTGEAAMLADEPTLREAGVRSVSDVAFLLDLGGGGLVVHRADGRVELWPGRHPAAARTLSEAAYEPGPTVHVYPPRMSPDGTHFVTCAGDGHPDRPGTGTFHVHEVDSGRLRARLRVPDTRWDSHACLGPAGRVLAETGSGSAIRIWTVAEGELVSTLHGHGNLITSLGFSADGARLASSGFDKTLCVWDVPGERLLSRAHAHLDRRVIAVRFSPDDQALLTSSTDGMFLCWDVEPLAVRRAVFDRVQPSVAAFRAGGGAPRFGGDGARILAASAHDVRVWDPEAGGGAEVLGRHTASPISEPYLYGVAYSADGGRILSAGWDGGVHVWDASTSTPVLRLEGGARMYAVCVDRADRWIAAGGRRVLRVWSGGTGALATECDVGQAYVNALTFSPDGTSLIAACADSAPGRDHESATGSLLLIDTGTWRQRRIPFGDQGQLTAVAHHPTRARVYVGSARGTFCYDLEEERVVWSVGNGAARHVIAMREEAEGLYPTQLAIDDRGRSIAATHGHGRLRFHDLDSGVLTAEIQAHVGDAYATAFLDGGRRIATAGADDTIRLWDRDGNTLLELRGHTDYVKSLAPSPDGRTLCSCSGDGSIRLWHTQDLATRTAAARRAVAESVRVRAALEDLLETSEPHEALRRFLAQPEATAARAARARTEMLRLAPRR